MKELTKAEVQVMQQLWKLKKAYLKDIVAEFPEPRPAYTTIATVIRVLVKKGFIGFKSFNRSNEYYPLIHKGEYFRKYFKGILSSFFNGSVTGFASYFSEMEELGVEELEEINQIIAQKLQEKKSNDEWVI